MSAPADVLQTAESRIAKLEAWAWGKRCSFCGKRNGDAVTLIEGDRALICDECVIVCLDVLFETALARRRSIAGGEP